MKQIRIGFFSAKNYLDKNAFSGTLYSMYQSLNSREFEVITLGRVYRPNRWINLFMKVKKILLQLNPKPLTSKENQKNFIQQVDQQLKKNPCDIIFAPVASLELDSFEPNIPIIYLSDTTTKLLGQTYNFFATPEDYDLAVKNELQAIAKADKIIYPSQWAAQSSIEDYHAKPDKIEIIPFGANIETIPPKEAIFQKCSLQSCRLLFIGKDWERKGGRTAFQALLSLLDMGLQAELYILGCTPPPEIKHDNLTIIPFLSKNIPEHKKRFNELLLNSHFLLLPTLADCSPIVICEASAYGMPVIASDVGGIPEMINNDRNGYMLDKLATGDEYAKVIANYFSDQKIYKQLVQSTREEYESRLNWDKWAESVSQVIIELLEQQH